MTVEALEALWEELEKEAVASGRRESVVRRLLPEADLDLDLFLAHRGETDQRALLLAVKDHRLASRISVPPTRGIEVAVHQFTEFLPDGCVLCVSLVLPQFKRMFAVMISDIICDLSALGTERERAEAVVSGILRWQRLLEKLDPGGLSAEGQRGLYGELHFLRHFVLSALDAEAAVASWTGPAGAPQDFQFRRCAIEVKSTVVKRHETIAIANEKQLDDSLVPALYLAHLRLTESPSAGLTLPAMVASIRESLGSVSGACAAFDAKLLDCGFHDAQAALYESVKYAVQSMAVYWVRGNFPRITDATLRNGVGDVRYSVAVSECHHYQVDLAQALQDIRSECNDA